MRREALTNAHQLTHAHHLPTLTMAEDDVLFDEVYDVCEIIGK